LILTSAGTYTMPVYSSGQVSTTTNSFTVNPAAASQLTVGSPSGNVLTNKAFSVTVYAKDPYGDVDTNFNGNVTITLANNPGGATLSGTLTKPAVNGVIPFTGLSLNKPGNGYTLLATSTGLTSSTSSPFNITNDQLVVVTQPPASLTAGTLFGLIVQA